MAKQGCTYAHKLPDAIRAIKRCYHDLNEDNSIAFPGGFRKEWFQSQLQSDLYNMDNAEDAQKVMDDYLRGGPPVALAPVEDSLDHTTSAVYGFSPREMPLAETPSKAFPRLGGGGPMWAPSGHDSVWDDIVPLDQGELQQVASAADLFSVPPLPGSLMRTRLCRDWIEKRECRSGASCTFAHDPDVADAAIAQAKADGIWDRRQALAVSNQLDHDVVK